MRFMALFPVNLMGDLLLNCNDAKEFFFIINKCLFYSRVNSNRLFGDVPTLPSVTYW